MSLETWSPFTVSGSTLDWMDFQLKLEPKDFLKGGMECISSDGPFVKNYTVKKKNKTTNKTQTFPFFSLPVAIFSTA